MNTQNIPLARILSIGEDRTLLDTRELLLRRGGYDVLSVSSGFLIEDTEVLKFDIVLICHTVRLQTAESIGRSLRALNLKLPIVRLSQKGASGTFLFDHAFDRHAGPAALLRDIREVRLTKQNGPMSEEPDGPQPASVLVCAA